MGQPWRYVGLTDESDKLAEMFHVGKTGFLQVGIRHLILLPKAYAGVVHHLHHAV